MFRKRKAERAPLALALSEKAWEEAKEGFGTAEIQGSQVTIDLYMAAHARLADLKRDIGSPPSLDARRNALQVAKNLFDVGLQIIAGRMLLRDADYAEFVQVARFLMDDYEFRTEPAARALAYAADYSESGDFGLHIGDFGLLPETGFSAAIVREVGEGMTPLVAFLHNEPFPSID